ncbi:MAG TPA: hypothetical protein VGP62_21050 [Bryobacteraceae bacterium]|nr:hypothetical protein [Bryobacteraceae bacterium]
MRRIGLTVGVTGAPVTAFMAFALFFSDLADHRKVQAEFNSLRNLPIIQRVAKTIAKNKIAGAYAQTQIPSFSDFVQQRQRNESTNAYVEIQGHPRGIKQFWVDEKSEIAWFEMDDGRTIMRTTGPTSLFWYLLYPPIAAVGFVLPWGAVRLVTWIVSGFIRSGATVPQKA